MLNDAARSAKPTRYAQNKCHGTNEGTPCWMNCAAERCSAPKAANGIAKHKLLKATTLSRPRASAISVLAAHSAISKSTRPALPMENAVRENSRNAARIVECMGMSRVWSRRKLYYRRVGENISLPRLDGVLKHNSWLSARGPNNCPSTVPELEPAVKKMTPAQPQTSSGQVAC